MQIPIRSAAAADNLPAARANAAVLAMTLALAREHQDRGEHYRAFGPDYLAARHFDVAEKASELHNALLELDEPAPAKLGRFGHHPDPAIDFCVEIEELEGLTYNVERGLDDRDAVVERITRAMDFVAAVDLNAINAKGTLRDLGVRVVAIGGGRDRRIG